MSNSVRLASVLNAIFAAVCFGLWQGSYGAGCFVWFVLFGAISIADDFLNVQRSNQ